MTEAVRGHADRRAARQSGFSLIEMIVAMLILSISMGLLYQSSAGATRNVRIDERYAYGILMAQSLIAEYPWLPAGGVRRSGEVEDFSWQLLSEPYTEVEIPEGMELHRLEARVSWEGGDTPRQVTLVTVVPVAAEEQVAR